MATRPETLGNAPGGAPAAGTLFDTSERFPDRHVPRPIGEQELIGAPPSFGELFDAGWEAGRVDRTDFETQMLADGYAPIVEALGLPADQNPAGFSDTLVHGSPVLRRSELRARSGRRGGEAMASRAQQEQEIAAAIRAARQRDPKAFPGLPDTVAGLRQHFREQEARRNAAAQATIARGEGFGGTVAPLLGGFGALGTDPANIASLPIGGYGGGSLLRIFAREALVNATIEGALQPAIASNRESIGLELTAGEALANVTIAGIFGGAIEAGGTAAVRALRPRFEQMLAERSLTGAVLEPGDLFAELDSREVLTAFRAVVPEDAMTPDERAAVNILTRDSEIAATSPFESTIEGDAEHAESLADAINALASDRFPENRPQPSAAGAVAPEGSSGRPPGASSTAPGGRVARSMPASIPQDVVDGLIAEGIPPHIARGAAAGVVAESGNRHTALGPVTRATRGQQAFGLGQWLFERQAELFRRYGPSPTRAQQIKYLAWELKGGDHGGKSVLSAKDEADALRRYIVDFMRPAKGRETEGDLERGMAALGRAGERIEAGLAAGEIEIDPAIARLRAETERLEEAIMAPPGAQAGIGAGPPLHRSTMRPGEILVDAARFQFKSGGDEAGVLDTLRGVDAWDPWSANPLIIWEDNAGKRWLADGHQRHGLATRLEAQGQEIPLAVNIMRERDGVSAEDARVYAALVNIRQGSGSAVDAAKVFKVRPEVLEAALPPQSALVRHAKGLARLSDPAFGMVVNGHVAPDHAAAVGRLAPDNPELHEGLMQVLVDTDPSSAGQAEFIVRQALAQPFHEAEQIGLFGAEMSTSSLFKQRAMVLEKGLAALRRARMVHRTAADEADRLEAAGSTIAVDASKREAQANAEAIEIVSRLAASAGPVADALNAAAARLANGGRIGTVVNEFVDAVRQLDLRALEREGGGNAGDGGSLADGGSPGDAGEAGPSLFDEREGPDRPGDGLEAERPTLAELEAATERFSDPDGPAVKTQADSLVHDFKAAMVDAAEAQIIHDLSQGRLDTYNKKMMRADPDRARPAFADPAAVEADIRKGFAARSKLPGWNAAREEYFLRGVRDELGLWPIPKSAEGSYSTSDWQSANMGRAAVRALAPDAPRPHISDQVGEVLQGMGFTKGQSEFEIRLEGVEEAGQLSTGARILTLRMDETGRYLERLDGNDVAKDVDLRQFPDDPEGAIAAVLDGLPDRYMAALRLPLDETEARFRGEVDFSHLDALRTRLSHERARLDAATSEAERATRQSTVDSVEREIAGELRFLNVREAEPVDMDDAELLAALADDLGAAVDMSKITAEDLDGLFDALPPDRDAWHELRMKVVAARPDLAAQALDQMDRAPAEKVDPETEAMLAAAKERRAAQAQAIVAAIDAGQEFMVPVMTGSTPLLKHAWQVKATSDGLLFRMNGNSDKWLSVTGQGLDHMTANMPQFQRQTFRLSEEGDEVSAEALLKELDDDEAAINAIKGCL